MTNKITKDQLNIVLKPIIYALCLAIPEGLSTEDLTYLLNNTLGLRNFKISFNRVDFILKSYTNGGHRKVFERNGKNWIIKKDERGLWNV
jgi:hypothetical protein